VNRLGSFYSLEAQVSLIMVTTLPCLAETFSKTLEGASHDEKLYERRMETVISEEALLPGRMQQLTLLASEITHVLQI